MLKKWLLVLCMLFVAGISFAQEIEVFTNESSRGSKSYGFSYMSDSKPHDFTTKYSSEESGDIYFINYRYSLNDYFGFCTYKKDTAVETETLDVGAGYGWYLIKSKVWRENISIAAILRGDQYITSLRLKSYIKAGILTIKNVMYYKPEIMGKTSDTDWIFKITKKTSYGIKHSTQEIKGKKDYSIRSYVKVVF